MPEPSTHHGTASASARPFPWFCPNCRRKEVRRTHIRYQCELQYQGRPVTVALDQLAVPQCAHCGELVFDYEADEQINQAYRAQTGALAAAQPSSPSPWLSGEPTDIKEPAPGT